MRAMCRPFAAQSPLVAGFMRRVRTCGNGAGILQQSLPFLVGGQALGSVSPLAAEVLATFPEVFSVSPGKDGAVELVAGGDSLEARSEAVANVLARLRASGRVPMLAGWRDEAWPVKADFDAPAALVVERAAGALFGVRAYGCHVNGIVDGNKLWVAKRAKTKQTFPGKLDHIVAGGMAHGEKPGENVVRECGEEASVPPDLASAARPAGFIEYCQADESGWGVTRDVIFCYDLEMPATFVPSSNDGEVESFALWDIRDVIASLVADNDDWKPNVAVVIIDMLVRRGLIAPENVGYVELVRSLRT